MGQKSHSGKLKRLTSVESQATLRGGFVTGSKGPKTKGGSVLDKANSQRGSTDAGKHNWLADWSNPDRGGSADVRLYSWFDCCSTAGRQPQEYCFDKRQ